MWSNLFMLVTTVLFGWQVHGWIGGLLAGLTMFVIVPILNGPMYKQLSKKHEDADDFETTLLVSAKVRRRIWAAYILIMIGIAVSGAELVYASQ